MNIPLPTLPEVSEFVAALDRYWVGGLVLALLILSAAVVVLAWRVPTVLRNFGKTPSSSTASRVKTSRSKRSTTPERSRQIGSE